MRASTLDWAELGDRTARADAGLVPALLALRRAEPDLSDPRLDRVSRDLRRRRPAGSWSPAGPLRVVCNLAGEARAVPVDSRVLDVLLDSTGSGARPSGTAVDAPGESVAVVRVAGS